MSISIGDLIIDNYGREGIVLYPNKQPDAEWLSIQEDARMHSITSGKWWLAMPLQSGGGVNVPESLATVLRRATQEDATALVARHEFTYVSLVGLFPGLKKPAALK